MLDETHVELTYFLKSALKSPKAAPVLAEVGVLSCPASTAASAPPWSLYKALVDMLVKLTVLCSSVELQTLHERGGEFQSV